MGITCALSGWAGCQQLDEAEVYIADWTSRRLLVERVRICASCRYGDGVSPDHDVAESQVIIRRIIVQHSAIVRRLNGMKSEETLNLPRGDGRIPKR